MTSRPSTAAGRLIATELRCDGRSDPIGIDQQRPLLSWVPVSERRGTRQCAARVLVASDPRLLSDGVGDRWDSGYVDLAEDVAVRFAGDPLASFDRCWWSVQLWDDQDRMSRPSVPATFEMGMLAADDWAGDWIAAGAEVSSPLLRTTFELDGPVEHAQATVVGLGYHEIRVNGRAPDDRVLHPAPSYADDTLTGDLGPRPRTRSATYDVGGLLHPGENAIGIVLGHGWFSAEADVPPSPYHRDPYGDRPVLRADVRIELRSGKRVTIASGPDWRALPGPTIYNDYSHGETFDARRDPYGWDSPGFADERWAPVDIVDGPNGPPAEQRTPASRVVETLPLSEVASPDPGVRLFDTGQHLTGWSRIGVRGQAGAAVTLRHASRLDAAGQLDTANHGLGKHVARQTDRYVLRGDETETWEPRFTLHGFRFVEVVTEGEVALESIEARVVHSDLPATGSFASSDALLGAIHSNTRWTFRASFQGFPQDAADRSERVGWLGDPGFLAEDYFYDFDSAALWADWLDDIRDAQLADGRLPVVAPPHWRVPEQGEPNSMAYHLWPDWMATYPLMIWQHYRFGGDRGLVASHLDGMRRFIAWMAERAAGHILELGLGDHMEPQPDGSSRFAPLRTPAALTSTALFYASTRITAAAARLTSDETEAAALERLAKAIRRAYGNRFFDRAHGRYASGSQTANAVSLWFGLVPRAHEAEVVADIVRDIGEHDGHLDTGIIGTAALEQTLPLHGAADVMLDVMRQTTFPSWGHQIELGATTLLETWADDPPDHSQNMKMFGAVPTFLYRDVAGITPAAPGWREITIHPKLTHRLEHARASIGTVRGPASVGWRRDGEDLRLDVTIPTTSRATVRLPAPAGPVVIEEGDEAIWVDGKGLRRRPGITSGKRAPDHVRLRMGGGTYAFRVRSTSSRIGDTR